MRKPPGSPTMAAMTDDLHRRRKGKARPEVRSLFDDLMATEGIGAEIGGPEFQALEARIEALPPADREALVALAEAAGFGMRRRLEENQEAIDALEGAEGVFAAAHAKLRAEGRPIDLGMTLEEAYRVLEE